MDALYLARDQAIAVVREGLAYLSLSIGVLLGIFV